MENKKYKVIIGSDTLLEETDDPCGMEISLDWQNGKKNVKERTKYLLDTGSWSDCSFLVGTDSNTKMFHAHKLVLAMSSPVFEAMFFGEMNECKNPIHILDIQPDIFRILLEYIYSDSIKLTSFDQSYKVCFAAKKYLLLDMVKLCLQHMFLFLHPHNACRAYEVGKFFEDDKLRESSLEVIKSETEAVLEHSSFEDAELETIQFILGIDSLNISSEKYIFDAVYKWTIRECARRGLPENMDSLRLVIEPVLGKIRFLCMTASDFARGPAQTSLLSRDEKLNLLINISCEENLTPMPVGFSEDFIPRSRYITRSTISQDIINRAEKLTCRRDVRRCRISFFDSKMHCCLSFSVDRPICILGFEMSGPTYDDCISSRQSFSDWEFIMASLLDADKNSLSFTHFSTRIDYGGKMEILFHKPIRIHKHKTYIINVATVNYEYGKYYEIGEADIESKCDVVTFSFKESTGLPTLIRSIIFCH